MAVGKIKNLTFLALSIAVVLVGLDFYIKSLVIANIEPFTIHKFIPGILDFTFVTNDSAAFSIGWGVTGVFTLIQTAAALSLIWYLRKIQTTGWAVMAGVLLGGITGNLVDRFMRPPFGGIGHVIDYIKIPFNFPIFNLADCLIVSMMVLTVLRVLAGHQIGKASKSAADD
ncbi:MAG: signal peptidase II [Micrococcales bacterium]